MLLISDRLTPDEIEALRRNRKKIHEFCQKLFLDMEQDTSAKPYRLTPSEIDSLRREMQASSAWMKQEFRRRYPNRIRSEKE